MLRGSELRSMRFRGSELLSLGVLVSARSNILLYHSLILLELFDDYESFLCSHVILIRFCEFLLSLVPIRDSFHLLLVLTVWIVFNFFHLIQLLFTFCCVVINHQKGGDCAHLGP